MPNKQHSRVAASLFIMLSILSFLFGLSGWFLVPPDPEGNVHGVMTAKVAMGVSGFSIAVISFLLAKYYLKSTTAEHSEKEKVTHV